MPGSPWRTDPRIRRRAEREELIERRRLELLDAGRPPLVELHGYTPAEFRRAVARGDPLATETAQRGVLLVGELPT